MSGYRAVVFDMDGVLVDTEPAFFDAANAVLAEEGTRIEWERYQVLLGTSVEVTWQSLIDMLGLAGEPKTYLRRYGVVLRAELAKPRPPLPGVVWLLDELSRREVPVALATSSWRPWAEIVLTSCGLAGRFHNSATGDEVAHEKPAPDIYMKAAGLLGVEPERCVAIEDTAPGIASAQAAGMHAIQVRASSTALPPLDAADLVLDSLEQFPLTLLAQS
ncbi:MAG: HAD family phosphatase [Dehalococcoidia bacterium]